MSRGAGRGTRGGGAADDGSVCCRSHAGVLIAASSVWSCNWAAYGQLGYIDKANLADTNTTVGGGIQG